MQLTKEPILHSLKRVKNNQRASISIQINNSKIAISLHQPIISQPCKGIKTIQKKTHFPFNTVTSCASDQSTHLEAIPIII
ncbi:hypothetical protein LX69_01530 [Breznakibacter xylanolyticus]|uniref:Uncharacterized protein n=1 Tax=Breznakibacter xylanolyticus TaxID=990 RepID=A0A2W7N9W7_9BACT|nr:hypothetical protein LX69_01530 [Breznakibacter xylanolyticus]